MAEKADQMALIHLGDRGLAVKLKKLFNPVQLAPAGALRMYAAGKMLAQLFENQFVGVHASPRHKTLYVYTVFYTVHPGMTSQVYKKTAESAGDWPNVLILRVFIFRSGWAKWVWARSKRPEAGLVMA